ncbi:hypothetical protein BaRGS_00019400 [Batillaria attramentaria]|uniref:Uncharacterized protein n=1 Tax=Batillaria attramentaria TaxID=370345 RepID=A0ABD0KQ42_9CAEN
MSVRVTLTQRETGAGEGSCNTATLLQFVTSKECLCHHNTDCTQEAGQGLGTSTRGQPINDSTTQLMNYKV